MATRFDDWEGGFLEHHGIKGMHWGVRRYQNEDGTLTIAGKERYGSNEHDRIGSYARKEISTSARRMQKDFNRLDKGYANVVAENMAAGKRVSKSTGKVMAYAHKRGYDENFQDYRGSDKKLNKLMSKTEKNLKEYGKTANQMKSIENLQWRILAKASEKGYTVKSKPVVRIGHTGKARAAAIFASVTIGGAIGGAISGGIAAGTGKKVQGQQVKIRKNGDGTQSVTNYAGANQRERERNRRRSG